MDYEKIGNFIKQLRIEHNMTQQQLADKIPVTREAVSKWERGRNKPDRTSLEIISKIFNVTTEELLLGRRNEIYNKKENKNLTLNLYDDNNKKQKALKISMISLLVILIIFFIYYFITNFNSIKIYNISYEDTNNNIMIYNGILVTTREKFYFNFSDIRTTSDITKLELYYLDNNRKRIIYETNNSYINIYDYYQYERYFDYNDLDIVVNNLYILIKTTDNQYDIKLKVRKDFANNKLFNFKEDNIGAARAHLLEYDTNIDINLIKEKFELKDNVYSYSQTDDKKKFYAYYIPMFNLLTIKEEINKNNYEEWNYYIDEKSIVYKCVRDLKTINSFSFNDEKYNCLNGTCTFDEEKIKYFFAKLSDILGKN